MALQSSGEISLSDIATEFQDAQPHSLSEFYGVASGVPGSGEIDFADFYGTSFLTSHTLSSNTANLNVYDYAVANGYSSGPYQLTINNGVIVYSTSSGTPALRINGPSSQGFAAGTPVTIINNGYISGGPGAGGSGGSSNNAGGSAGSKGGTAVQVQPSGNNITNIITFTNNGSVLGGGGGGGGGGAGLTNTVSGTTTLGPYYNSSSYFWFYDDAAFGGVRWNGTNVIGGLNTCPSNTGTTSCSAGGYTYTRGSHYRTYVSGKLTITEFYVSRSNPYSTTHNFTAGGSGGLGGYHNGSSFVSEASGGSASGGGNGTATGGNGGSGGNIGVAGSSGSNGGGGASGGGGGAIGHYWHRNASLSGSGAWTFTNNGTATGTTAN